MFAELRYGFLAAGPHHPPSTQYKHSSRTGNLEKPSTYTRSSSQPLKATTLYVYLCVAAPRSWENIYLALCGASIWLVANFSYLVIVANSVCLQQPFLPDAVKNHGNLMLLKYTPRLTGPNLSWGSFLAVGKM